jgi:acetylornithine deacetylase/succinyl-diaminopimelate desuccinylase-like protein
MGDEAFIPKDVDGTPYGIPGPAIQGRGVTEQIAPLAAAVEAVWALADAESKLRRSLLFATITSGETGSHEVVDAMAVRGDLDVGGVVLVAGTGNAICLGNLGRVDIEVEVRGLACHSSDPSRGLNAIEGLARFLERLRLVQLREDPEIGRATLTPVNVETWPKALHTVPDRARLILDRRLVPGETVEQAMQEIRDALVDFDPFTLEVHARKFQLPSKVAPDEGPAQIVRTALEAVTGTSRIVYWRAALDAGFFTARGIQTVVFGPGDLRLAHTDYELVSVSEVIQATEVYRRVLLESCGAQ